MITGEKFKTIADYIYTPAVKYEDDFNDFGNTLDYSLLKDGDIIYTHTMFVKQLFEIINDKKFILISHNCDTNVDISFHVPYNLIRWFAQNVDVTNPKIESIPIGLENNRWFPERHKKEKIIAKLNEPRDYRNLVYMNHNAGTNPAIRSRLYHIYEGESWVTSEKGFNGSNFDGYIDNIYNHKFMICPQGNGIDTHRTWECLYLGTIPIEKYNLNNRFYTDLPICFVDRWEDITEDFLNTEYERISCQQWNYNKLSFDYWRNKIKNESILYTSKIFNSGA